MAMPMYTVCQNQIIHGFIQTQHEHQIRNAMECVVEHLEVTEYVIKEKYHYLADKLFNAEHEVLRV